MTRLIVVALSLILSVLNLYGIDCTNAKTYIRHNYKDFPKAEGHRSLLVYLNNWTYEHIREECINVLGPQGYAAVQISPVTSHAKDQRLSVASYEIKNESGDEKQLLDMIEECNKQNVRVLIDVVLNNMMNPDDEPVCSDYKDLNKKKTYGSCGEQPMYSEKDFHNVGAITESDYEKDIKKVRTGDMLGRHDLKQVIDGVPNMHIVKFLYKLITFGAAGFRVLSADHMDPEELRKIYDMLPDLIFETEPTRPFIYSQVWDPFHNNKWAIKDGDYINYARVTDYKYAVDLALTFKYHKESISALEHLDKNNLRKSEDSVVFVNTVMTQVLKNRGVTPYPTLEHNFINHDEKADDKAFKLAVAFILSRDHGIPMLSTNYTDTKEKAVQGDRWQKVKEIVSWRNDVVSANGGGSFPKIDKWTSHSNNQVSYCTGNHGFVVFNDEHPEKELNAEVEVCFEKSGIYCDVFSGGLKNKDGNTPTEVCHYNYIEVKKGEKVRIHMKHTEGLQLYSTKHAKVEEARIIAISS